jgi:hypothetical protein
MSRYGGSQTRESDANSHDRQWIIAQKYYNPPENQFDSASGSYSHTTMISGSWSAPLRRLLLPMRIAAAFGGPFQDQISKSAFISGSQTQLVRFDLDVDTVWEHSPQLITNDQVEALNQLLAMPYVTGPGIGDLYDE